MSRSCSHARKGISLDKAEEGADLVEEGRDQELGLFHHRSAGRNRRDHPGDD